MISISAMSNDEHVCLTDVGNKLIAACVEKNDWASAFDVLYKMLHGHLAFHTASPDPQARQKAVRIAVQVSRR